MKELAQFLTGSLFVVNGSALAAYTTSVQMVTSPPGNAVIVSVDQYSEPQASGNYVLVEDVALSYGRIEITNPLVPGKACYDLRLGAACQ